MDETQIWNMNSIDFFKTRKITKERWSLEYPSQYRARIFHVSAKTYFKLGTIQLPIVIKFRTKKKNQMQQIKFHAEERKLISIQRQIQLFGTS